MSSRIFIQNSLGAGSLRISKNPRYWTSRLKGMAWAAAFEVQWKVGPLSEASIGNAGGWFYVPGCGIKLWCLNNPKDPKPPTNNTGLSDWILTPVVGMGWVTLEDTLDKYVVAKVAENHAVIGGKILRTALEPSRSFAGLFWGKLPWQWPAPENRLVSTARSSTLRFDVGTTMVRYLRDCPNPRLSPLGSMQSTEYYVNQGNFRISSGYTIRF